MPNLQCFEGLRMDFTEYCQIAKSCGRARMVVRRNSLGVQFHRRCKTFQNTFDVSLKIKEPEVAGTLVHGVRTQRAARRKNQVLLLAAAAIHIAEFIKLKV